MKVGTHQGPAVSLLLFIKVLENTRNCRSMLPWDLLYADDIVISAETETQSMEKFNNRNKALQKRDLKLTWIRKSI